MSSPMEAEPHAVLVPLPAQGHINPMLKLATLLHSRGFHLTLVITEHIYCRLARSEGGCGHWAAAAASYFRIETIPDGLPPSGSEDDYATQDILALCLSVRRTCLPYFRDVMGRLSRAADGRPPVTCIVSDSSMGFTVDEDFGVPVFFFFTHSACGCLSYLHFGELVRTGFTPLKDESFLKNGYLDTPIDCIPGLEGVRIRDLPSFVRTTDPDDVMLRLLTRRATYDVPRADGIILNTFDDLEGPALSGIRSKLPNLYAIGPLSLLSSSSVSSATAASLWKEDAACIDWLDAQAERSVLYVNFGSITVLTAAQLLEFAWGLARSEHPFLWVMRPGIARSGEAAEAGLDDAFAAEVEGRGVMATWCDQEKVLGHRATAAFLSHCGWNSTLESLTEGVPMICWPFFAEQPTNCRHLCAAWGVGLEIIGDVGREEVEKCVREVMVGKKGKEMRGRAWEWREKAREAVRPGGSSMADLERLVKDLTKTRVGVRRGHNGDPIT